MKEFPDFSDVDTSFNQTKATMIQVDGLTTFPVLYKRAKRGQPQQWQIFAQGDHYWTEAGQVGGIITRSMPTICTEMNEGRANNRNPEMQAIAEATSKHTKKVSSGYVDSLARVDEPQPFFKPMLAHKFPDKKDKIKWGVGRHFTQFKLDGIRCEHDANSATTRNGKPHMCIPHITAVLQEAFDRDPNLRLDGELYNHLFHDDFNEISSIIRKSKPTAADLEKAKKLTQYHIYDCPQIGDLTMEDPFIERYNAMVALLTPIAAKYDCIQIVPTYEVFSEADMHSYHTTFVANGYEGAMYRLNAPYVHDRSDSLLKLKTFDEDEFVIESIQGGAGNKAGIAVTITVHTKSGVECSPNIKATDAVKRSMLRNKEKYIGHTCTVRYFGLTPDTESLRFPWMIDIDRWLYE